MTSIRSAGLRLPFTPQTTARLCVLASFLLVPALTSTQAQDLPAPPDEAPAHIAVVDGSVTLERDATAEPAQANVPLLAGDRLRTAHGRVEVLFGDGSALDLDENSGVDLVSDSLMRLRGGRVRLSVARGSESIDYRVDASSASVAIRASGDYRLALGDARSADPDVDLSVLRGSAELSNALGRTLVGSGMHAVANSRSAPSESSVTYANSQDAFDQWADDQRAARLSTTSAPYLPSDLQPYGGSLDRSGTWAYEPDYGNVWYPRVAATWEPYYDGSWSYVGAYGWTWVGLDAWSWPTHHYGRWGLRGSRWFWIPDRQWGPAWVSWASAPGYVSWCPLGFDNRALFDIGLGFGARGFESRFGWNVIPSGAFVPNVFVSRYVVSRPALAPAVWSQFSRRDAGPSWRGALASAAPLRSPHVTNGRAMSRGPIAVQSSRSLSPRDTSATAGRPVLNNGARTPSASGTPAWRVENQGSGAGFRQGPQAARSAGPRSYSPESTARSLATVPSRQSFEDRRFSMPTQARPSYAPRTPAPSPRTDFRGPARITSGSGSSSPHASPSYSTSHPASSASSSSGRHAPASGSSRGSASRRGGGR